MVRARTLVGAAAGLAVSGLLFRQSLRRNRRWNFNRRVVLITGGSRGLGLVLARQFAAEGARLATVARDAAELDRACHELNAAGAEVLGLPCDVRSEASASQAVEAALRHYGRLDVLVNNAGVIQVAPLENMSRQDFEDAMAVHLWGPLNMILAALPHMRQQRQGRIVNISSIGGKVAMPHLVPYSASKFALVGLSDGLHAELVKSGIHVTTVCPGLMRTGSPARAFFKGHHDQEFTWFAISDSLPLVTVSAERAAKSIVKACRYGDPHLVISVPAKVVAFCAAVFPNLTIETLSLVHRLLPKAAADAGDRSWTGLESQTAWAPSLLTRLSDRAAARNNELPRNGKH